MNDKVKEAQEAWNYIRMQRIEWINERVQLSPLLGDYIAFQIGQGSF